MKEKIYQYINDITESSKNDKLVFFVGAGVSALSNYPSWRSLVDNFYEKLYGHPKQGDYPPDEFLRIPQMFYNVKGKSAYDSVLTEVFQVDRQTNPIHDKILGMNPKHIITTNYDNLIDTACWKRGKYFSVISTEADVANPTSPRYLLKVHGDFRKGYVGENVVLKEDDYLNYDQDYPLISNLTKTILATHSIVFIGYGLGDYNINMLLNWVRKLQKDSYQKPFFIRTDPLPIEQETQIYYENKGLQIIDAAGLVEDTEIEYLERYSVVMDLLIESTRNKIMDKDNEVIGYIYRKISPLFALPRVRKIDLKHVFEYDYVFDINGTVVKYKNKGYDYMKRFFELKNNETVGSKLSDSKKDSLKLLSEFFENIGVIGMAQDVNAFSVSTEIISLAYHSKYKEMEGFIDKPSINIEEDYKKAFFLAFLGRWKEAYNLYSDIILNSIDESNWWIHYLSHINRYRLYQSITQSSNYLNGIGVLTFGVKYKPFTDNFLLRIEREMKNFSISDLFSDMPFEFKKNYKTLEVLSDNKFLYEDTIKLFELTNKTRSEMGKGSYTIGMSSEHIVLFRMYENLRFIYENCIWFVSFKEFHQYVKNSMSLLIEKAEYERIRDIDEFGFSLGGGKSEFSIGYNDFVGISKSFKVEDIKHLERSCSIDQIPFIEEDEIEGYLVRLAERIIEQFSNGGMNIIFYTQFITEVKVAFYFAKYVRLSEEGYSKIVRALLFYIPKRDLDIGKQYIWVERLCVTNGLPDSVTTIIDDFLVAQAKEYKNESYSEESTNGLYSSDFAGLLNHFTKSYTSENLSSLSLKLAKDMKNQLNFIIKIIVVLSPEAKNHVMDLYEVNTISDLFNGVRAGLIQNFTSEYEKLIISYMEKQKSDNITEKDMGVKFSLGNSYIETIGIWYFLEKINIPRMKEFIGIDNQYDFFVSPQTFNFDKFTPSWLKNYNNYLLEKISKNEYMRYHVLDVLKERVENTNDKRYLEILMQHFL